MDDEAARQFVARNHRGVLTTQKRDGRPQISLIAYFMDKDGTLKISVTQDRAKTKNLRRDPRASVVCLDPENWYSYVVVEGSSTFLENDLGELRRYYRQVRGEDHSNWEEYDQAMLREKRLLLVIKPEKFYGMVR